MERQDKTRVLVIDDEEDFLYFVKLNLEKTGRFEVHTAEDGRIGIKLAEKIRPDLILLDIIMPGLDGGEVAAKLKENRKTERIPVVFLTAVLTPEDENVNLKKRFIAKPVLPEELIGRIDSILKRVP